MTRKLFPALLRFWRGRRGVSQLDLAMEANVSTRHVSFLESGRAQPSLQMVLRLLGVLGVPLRDQNEALVSAGFAPHFPESAELTPEVDHAILQMMQQHEPYPLTVLSLDGTILRANRAAQKLFHAFLKEPDAQPKNPDIYTLHFDPRFLRPFTEDWEVVAQSLLSRLHRDALWRGDDRLMARVDQLLAFPGVPPAWRQPRFAAEDGPTLTVRYRRDKLRVGFLITVTTFSAARQVTLDELRIESCFPVDAETRTECARLSGE